MSYRDDMEDRRSRSGFRTSMDIGMGIFYIAIGCVVIYYKAMGAIQIYPIVAYILGGMMVVGGIARLLRGIKTVRGNRSNSPGTD